MVKKKKPNGYWSQERCYKEAKKYNSRGEFNIKSPSAYSAAQRYGWLEQYDWFKQLRNPKGYWSYERCYNESKKYHSRSEFQKYSNVAYDKSAQCGWLDDFFSPKDIKPKGYWSYERCYKEALKYFSRNEFCEGSVSAYAAALRNNWLNDYDWLERQIHKGNDYWIYSYEDKKNKVVYVGLTWRSKRHSEHKYKKTDSVYRYFKDNIPKPRVLMAELDAVNAQNYEDWYKKAYKREGWTVLNKAKTGEGHSSLGGVNVKWDYEKCKQEAQKYNTKTSFKNGSGSAYAAASRNNWLNDYDWFLTKAEAARKRIKWTKEACYNEALKYKSKYELYKKCGSAYNASLKNHWIDDYYWLQRQNNHNF